MRLNGVQEVVGSNPAGPIVKAKAPQRHMVRGSFVPEITVTQTVTTQATAPPRLTDPLTVNDLLGALPLVHQHSGSPRTLRSRAPGGGLCKENMYASGIGPRSLSTPRRACGQGKGTS